MIRQTTPGVKSLYRLMGDRGSSITLIRPERVSAAVAGFVVGVILVGLPGRLLPLRP